MTKICCRSIGLEQNFEQRHSIEPNSFLLGNKNVHLVKIKVKVQNALVAPNYVGHQIDHVLTIIAEPMKFLGG